MVDGKRGRGGSQRGGGRPQSKRDGDRRGTGQRDRRSGDNRDTERKDGDKKERKPFVPWLGEERPKKGPIIDLENWKDKEIAVAFVGGREVTGVLTGFDTLMNLVLEDVRENLENDQTRKLGTLVARGPLIQSIAPVEGSAPIENPF